VLQKRKVSHVNFFSECRQHSEDASCRPSQSYLSCYLFLKCWVHAKNMLYHWLHSQPSQFVFLTNQNIIQASSAPALDPVAHRLAALCLFPRLCCLLGMPCPLSLPIRILLNHQDPGQSQLFPDSFPLCIHCLDLGAPHSMLGLKFCIISVSSDKEESL
jgi:hypothetical protein